MGFFDAIGKLFGKKKDEDLGFDFNKSNPGLPPLDSSGGSSGNFGVPGQKSGIPGFDDHSQQQDFGSSSPSQFQSGIPQSPLSQGDSANPRLVNHGLGSAQDSSFPSSQQPSSPSSFQEQMRSPQMSSPVQRSSDSSTDRSGGGDLRRDLELINSKLDTIKAVLVSLDQRVSGLEGGRVGKKRYEW